MNCQDRNRTNRPSIEILEDRCLLNYSLIDLGVLPDANAFLNGLYDINEQGSVGGFSESAFVWTPDIDNGPTGSKTALAVLPETPPAASVPGALSNVNRLNEQGQSVAVGWALNAAKERVPTLWRDTEIFNLTPGFSGEALNVNDDGSWAAGFYHADVGYRHAFVGNENSFTDLHQQYGVPESSTQENLTIYNEAIALQQIVGQTGIHVLLNATEVQIHRDGNGNVVYQNNGTPVYDVRGHSAYLLHDLDGDFNSSDGVLTNLGYLDTNRLNTRVTDINSAGQIVGSSLLTRGPKVFIHAMVVNPVESDGELHWYEDSQGDGINDLINDLGTLGKDKHGTAFGINDHGQIVGRSGSWPDDDSETAVLWENGQIIDLNDLIPAGTGWRLEEARAINNHGQIVGDGESPHTPGDYGRRGFLLTAPTSLPVITISDAIVSEADGTATLTVTLSSPHSETLMIDFDIRPGTASDEDLDYFDSSGTLIFAPGETTQTITVIITDDMLEEDEEFFHVLLLNPRNLLDEQTAVFLDAQAKISILDNDGDNNGGGNTGGGKGNGKGKPK